MGRPALFRFDHRQREALVLTCRPSACLKIYQRPASRRERERVAGQHALFDASR